MARGMAAAKGGVAAGKKKGSVSDTFPIDCTCTKPAEDKIMEQYLWTGYYIASTKYLLHIAMNKWKS